LRFLIISRKRKNCEYIMPVERDPISGIGRQSNHYFDHSDPEMI